MRMSPTRPFLRMALVVPMAAITSVVLMAGAAAANPQVTVPISNPHNNQTVTVSGTGFPAHSKDPTGVQILECSDPGGSVVNLPETAASCDGATVDPLPVNTDASGGFSAKYTFTALNNAHGGSDINCDSRHFCVLWVGVDYNQQFLGTHAFSTAFKIGGLESSPAAPSNVLVVVLPIVAVVIVATLVVLRRRRVRALVAGRAAKAEGEKLRIST
jgi:hypothetical protein